jgi:hypothetical protein
MVNFNGGPGTAAPAGNVNNAPANSISYDQMRDIAGSSAEWRDMRQGLANNQNNIRCQACGGAGPFSPDHVVPFRQLYDQFSSQLTVGQMVAVHNYRGNLTPLCRTCNTSRGADPYASFLRRQVESGRIPQAQATRALNELRRHGSDVLDFMGKISSRL